MASLLLSTQRTNTTYQKHCPEQTKLYQLIEDNHQNLSNYLSQQGKYLPNYVKQEFEKYLQCGRLGNGFLRVKFQDCHHERLIAFSCKKRGFWSGRHPVSCGASRMTQTAALLIDHILPYQPIRQWVISLLFPLR
ncbi:MAG: transposase zinc-binding domain-containing protein [Pseudomonadales bacterium]|nr:transposase zinc-binding domain-containing protein [Pseudomonadales bacterium]